MAGVMDGSHLSREARRAGGVFYTPAPIVRYIVREALRPLLSAAGGLERPIRVLDPACGAGVFLEEACRRLLRWRLRRRAPDGSGGRRPFAARQQDWRDWIVRTHLFGVDADGEAVEAARRRLAAVAISEPGREGAWGGGGRTDRLAAALADHIRCGDALIGPDFDRFASSRGLASPPHSVPPISWEAAFPSVLGSPEGGFDAIVGNPPYINARRLVQNRGRAAKQYYRANYRCARGGYDAYVLFLEKALQLLRPGGVCGVIAPNKLATLDYASACRALLIRETTLRQIVDVSGLGLFAGAGVYPYIFIWRKKAPSKTAQVAVLHAHSLKDLTRPRFTLRVRQADMSPERGWFLHGVLDVESRVPTRPLADRAEVRSGATGFAARRLAGCLLESGAEGASGACFDFIVSGNIDRYRIRLGRVRFMKRAYSRPLLPKEAAVLTAAKRRLYERPKIVVAGMSRRLEAAWDSEGLALGVQVFAAAEWKDDPLFLLALLNSKLLSYLFRIRFQAKRLAGEFLSVNKGQLEKLPLRTVAPDDREGHRIRKQIIRWSGRLHQLRSMPPSGRPPKAEADGEGSAEAIDRRIDRLVYRLYQLTAEEQERVESAMNALGESPAS